MSSLLSRIEDLPTTVVIPSDLAAAHEAEKALLAEVADCNYSEAATFAIKLAVEEGMNNAVKHGSRFDSRKTVELVYDISKDRAVITITDQGGGFDPSAVPDPTADENLEKPTGRGVMLMRAYMDEVVYNSKGNQVRMVKRNT
jgi:serine/threonine-protein kinase RsbW